MTEVSPFDENDSLPIRIEHGDIDPTKHVTWFHLPDGHIVSLLHVNPGVVDLLWPTDLPASDFYARAQEVVGLIVGDDSSEAVSVPVVLPYFDEVAVAHRIQSTTSGTDIVWHNLREQLLEDTYEGGVSGPVLDDVDIGGLMDATGTQSVVEFRNNLLRLIIPEL